MEDADGDPNRFDAVGEHDSPLSLYNITLNIICDNLTVVVATRGESPSSSSSRLRLRRGVHLHAHLSEQLLERLCARGHLDDDSLSLFDDNALVLKRVKLSNGSTIGPHGLGRLVGGRRGTLTDLEVRWLNLASATDLLDEISRDSNLKSLDVAQCRLPTNLSMPSGLTSLNVSGTSFDSVMLESVLAVLPHLESLDVSLTRVDKVICLQQISHRLKSLNLHGLRLREMLVTVRILAAMVNLQHLDISDEVDNAPRHHPLSILDVGNSDICKISASDFLCEVTKRVMPNLRSLDLSAKEDINPGTLCSFIDLHPDLIYLGLAFTDVCEHEAFVSLSGGMVGDGTTATEKQLMATLGRYGNRHSYVQKTFRHLFRLSCITTPSEPQAYVIQTVVRSANRFRTWFGIQVAATAYLFKLVKRRQLHPRLLLQVVEMDMNAMEAFPNQKELQRNVLMMLCDDRMLQEVRFDKYRCTRLVMDCLCGAGWQEDVPMTRMCVAICSILVAQITTRQMMMLGSHVAYMSRLLSIVRSHTEAKDVDVTLRFTLSALWNLTDESPTTCAVFLDQGGMELCIDVLRTFSEDLAVEAKIVGLLNNVAEVKELRSRSIDNDEFVILLRNLLRSKHIEVSYFAGGIAAHLMSGGSWTLISVSKEELMLELSDVVSGWEMPKIEMVAYRSFAPFFPLLSSGQCCAVQLWAAWGVHHVCSKNHKKYCPKLVEQGGVQVLLLLMEDLKANPTPSKVERKVASLCHQVLEMSISHCYVSQSDTLEIQHQAKPDFSQSEEKPDDGPQLPDGV